MDDSFFQSLSESTVVLTVNRRLANYIQNQYSKYQQKRNQSTWVTPKILPLTTWLKLLWKKTEEPYQILSDFQERLLWKEITQQHESSISTIQQAWNTIHLWDTETKLQSHFQWFDPFKKACQKYHCITASEIPNQLLPLKTLSKLHFPATLFLVGFDELPPTINNFLEKIKIYCSIKIIDPTKRASKIDRIEFNNKKDEIHSMIGWAIAEHKKNPQQKFACVAPNLTQIRPTILRTFLDYELQLKEAIPFNISAGQTLNQFPLIQTALHILNEKWEHLLQSSYLAQTEDDLEIGAFADQIRRTINLSQLNTQNLLPILTSLQKRFPKATLLKRWNQLIAFRKNNVREQTLYQWLQTFTEILQIMKWPGTRVLNTTEHQILQRWKKALEELISCDIFLPKIKYETALTILEQHISHIIFQPKSQETGIQILGILETAGITFDGMWIMGLDNETWPPAASPNPFLPYELQRKYHMPHSSAQRELEFTQKIMNRLLNSAKTIYLSSANKDGDKDLAPSPLIHTMTPILFTQSISTETNFNSSYELIDDSKGTPLEKNKIAKGGSSILKYQSLCPFKAYASFRLNTEPLEKPALGLSPRFRGQLLHQVLELFWKRIKNQETLLKMSEQNIQESIIQAIECTVTSQTIYSYNNRFIAIEKKRLEKIVTDWLNIEKERTPFIVVAQEENRPIKIGSLTFQIRVDRIDQLKQDNSRIIIDYKTGNCTPYDWFGDRPTDPQLPIYCVFSDELAFDGLAFAQVRAGDLKFKGITAKKTHETMLDPISQFNNSNQIDDWDTLTNHWQQNLKRLSQDFSAGVADINPLKVACEHCELQPLCRINECQH